MWSMETYTSYLLSDMNVTKLGKKLVAERKKESSNLKAVFFLTIVWLCKCYP